MYNASEREAARKKIHAKVTSEHVIRVETVHLRRGNLSSRTSAERRFQNGSVREERTKYDPCSAPQIMYVQLAPCHKPLMRNVMNKLNAQRGFATLLPPRGI